MPGWHEATEELRDAGKIRMVGIIQEQHPDRAALFMQWKEMGWPLLVDSYNLLEVPYVPITLAIDERGIVRRQLRAIRDGQVIDDAFLEEAFAPAVPPGARARQADAASTPTASASPATTRPDLAALRAVAVREDTPDAWRDYGNAVAVWGGEDRLERAIEAFGAVVREEPEDGWALFRLGVALRARYDSEARGPDDFRNAVSNWSAALAIDPNQYIWRRRIQQYGPRLDKPYPFYDWVPVAREEVRARGQDPVPLIVEPRGSEFAEPAREFVTAGADALEPDPRGRVLRDDGDFITAEVVAVPPTVAPGEVARFHVTLRPILEKLAHWNNEVDETVIWVDPPRGWEVEAPLLSHPLPPNEVVSQETRIIEVEVKAPRLTFSGPARIPAYALYYVCEDVNGICMYRRQDLVLSVRVERDR